MACEPMPSVEIGHMTVPVPLAATDTLAAAHMTADAIGVPPDGVKTSLKVTFPDSPTLPEGVGVTVAVKVTGSLTVEGSVGFVTTTDTLPTFTCCEGDKVPVVEGTLESPL